MSLYRAKTRPPSRPAQALDGQIVTPEDARFDVARRAWNLTVDQQPTAVVFPDSAEDVAAAVRFARQHDLRIAPQGTGHNAGPLGSLENTILLKTEARAAVMTWIRAVRVEEGNPRLTILDRKDPETMTITLEHVLVPAHDREASARFLAGVLGLEYLGLGSTAGPPAFARVRVGPTTLDFVDAGSFDAEHYAFKVSDEDLDAILTRVKDAGLSFYSDPGHEQEGELNDWNGGRGFYFSDPNDGHNMELLTRPA